MSLPTPVLEIGGTHVTAALIRPAGSDETATVEYQQRFDLDSSASAPVITDRLLTAARSLQSRPHRQEWGVAIPGPFDYDRGVGEFTGVGKFDALNGVDLGQALVDGIGAATDEQVAVRFVNDATAFGLGECASGAGRAYRRVICLTLGTGVGSAFIADGVAVSDGPTVPPNGWVYRLSWQGAPLENTVSRRAIRAAHWRRTGDDLDVREIAHRALDGDRVARDVIQEAMAVLGAVVRPWVRCFGATALVLGGSIAGSWELITTPLRETLGDLGSQPALLPAELGDDAALIGAAAHADRHDRRQSVDLAGAQQISAQ